LNKYEELYYKVTSKDAEDKLSSLLDKSREKAILVAQMLKEANPENVEREVDELLFIKDRVSVRILEFIVREGILSESTYDLKEANINDLVYTIMSAMIKAC